MIKFKESVIIPMKSNMKMILSCVTAFLLAGLTSQAQSGNNQLQFSGQLSRPTSALLEVTNIGYGGAVKGMYGFGDNDQQATLEAGYNRFPVKHLPTGVEAHYSSIPIYGGYRYLINSFSLEAQVGLAVNRIIGRNSQITVSDTHRNLGWALGIGYTLKGLEIAARYQVSDVKGTDDDLNFLGIRLAYNISL